MSTGTSAAAEAVLADMAEETLEHGAPAEQERAVEHLQNLGVEVQEEPTAPDPEDAAIELPESAPEDWLEPEFEAEYEPEASAEEEDDEIYVDEDEALRKERAARVKAEKEAAHYKALRAKDSRKLWIAEAKEHAPLAAKVFGDDFSKLKAESHKDFRKQAAEAHNTMVAALADLVGPERVRAADEARAAAAQQFGRPTTGPSVVPTEAAEARAKVEKLREANAPLNKRIRALWDSKQIEI